MSSSPTVPSQAATEARAAARGAELGVLPSVPGWMLPVLVVAVGLVFWKGLGGALVYDDLALVARNPVITSFENLGAMFASSYWDFLDPREAKDIAYWRPLTSVYLTFGYALGDGRPEPFHALSLLTHLGATLVAFRLVLRLTRRAGTAFWTALLFGLHPLHVESVAWISAINDPLYGLFSLLTLAAFLAWRERGSKGSPWLACVGFALALLSKEIAAATLLLVALLDLARLPLPARDAGGGEPRGHALADRFLPFTRAYAPLLVVLGLYLLARVQVFGELTAGFGRTITEYRIDDPFRLVKLRVELLGGGLALLVWPAKLALFREVVPVLRWTSPAFLGPLLASLALVATAVLLARRRARLALAAVLLVPLALLPALVRPESLGRFPLSDRFLYLSVLGFALLVVLAAARFLHPLVATAALALVAGGYAVKSEGRLDVWRDEVALFEAAREESPLSPYVRWGLGRVYLERFDRATDPADLERALAEFEQANDLLTRAKEGDEEIFFDWNDRLQANLGTGTAYLLAARHDPLRDFETPRTVFEMITRAFPQSHHAWTGLGAANLGLGDYRAAGEALHRALALNERHPEAHFNLGRLYAAQGKYQLAKKHQERALALRPGHLADLIALADLEFDLGDAERGIAYAREAHERYPNEAEPLVILGVMSAARGDFRTALRRLDEALEREPENGRAHLERGKVLNGMGEVDGAIAELRRACDRLPESFEAHYNLAALLLQNGARDAALPFLERAYSLGGERTAMVSLRGTLMQLRGDEIASVVRYARTDLERGSLLEANVWIDRALDLDEGNPIVHYLRGRIQRSSDLFDEAVASQLRALAIHEEYFQAHFELGDLLADLGRRDEALVHLRRAREFGPPASWEEGLIRATAAGLDKLIQKTERELEGAGTASGRGE